MIILRSPTGWTGPKVVDGKQTEGTFRSHQVPMGEMSRPGHVKTLEKWLRCSTAEILPVDDHVAPDGRVMEMLS